MLFLSDSSSYLGDDPIWPIVQFISFNQNIPKMIGILCIQHNQFNSGNKKCYLKNMFSMFMLHHIYTHPFYRGRVHWVIVVLRLSDEPMCNNVSFIKCWTLMLRWEEVENKLGCFIHEVMVTPFSRGYVNGCNNGFVSHKNPKRNPPGFHEIWVTWPLLIYWSHVQESNYRYCILKLSAERGHGSSITLKCLSLVSREDLLLCFKLFPWKSMWHSSQTSFNQTSSQINCQASSPNEKKTSCVQSFSCSRAKVLPVGWLSCFFFGREIPFILDR